MEEFTSKGCFLCKSISLQEEGKRQLKNVCFVIKTRSFTEAEEPLRSPTTLWKRADYQVPLSGIQR